MTSPKIRFKDEKGDSFPNWNFEQIGNITEIVGGGTPSTSITEYWNGPIQWLTPTEINSKYVHASERTITFDGLSNSSAKLLPTGALLLTTRATIGACSINNFDGPICTNQGFQSLICKNSIHNEFAYYAITFDSFQRNLVKHSSGSTFLEISPKNLKRLILPVPDIREQEKIASFFSAIDQKIALAERKLSLQSRIRRGLEKGFFSRSISVNTQNQVPWKKYLLGDIAESFYSGSTPKSQMVKYYSGDIPWATSLDLNRNLVLSTGKCLSTEGFNSCNLKLLPKGSFVFSTCGVEAENVAGNCGILGMDSAISQSLMCIKPKESVVSSKFLFYWYRCFGKEICKRYAHGTKQLHLNIDLMSDIEIQLPSLNEQNKIIEILDSVEEKYQLLEKEVLALRKLKQSLLQQMFI